MHDYESLPPDTRVWIYQGSRPFAEADIPGIREQVKAFAQRWVSHNRALRSYGDVWHDRFVVLMVDETRAGASGCSIDTSVHFLQDLAEATGVDLFDRMIFTYRDNTTRAIQSAPREEFMALYQQGKIDDDTVVFDNLIQRKADFEDRWEKRLADSWHKRMD